MTGKRTRQATGAGWERIHVCVDDATRLAYVEVLPDEKARTAIGFLKRAVAFYAAHGVEVERVMTDNGPAYASIAHAIACRALKIRHIRTRPFRPQTQRLRELGIEGATIVTANCDDDGDIGFEGGDHAAPSSRYPATLLSQFGRSRPQPLASPAA